MEELKAEIKRGYENAAAEELKGLDILKRPELKVETNMRNLQLAGMRKDFRKTGLY